MSYIGTQPNNVKENTGIYTPNDILELDKKGYWGGKLDLIQSQTASGVATLEFTSIKEDIYDIHLLWSSDTYCSSSNSIGLKLMTSSGVYTTSDYALKNEYNSSSGSRGNLARTADAGWIYHFTSDNSSSTQVGGSKTYLFNLGNSSAKAFWTMQHNGYNTNNSQYYSSIQVGAVDTAQAYTGLHMYTGATSFSGQFDLYGVKL